MYGWIMSKRFRPFTSKADAFSRAKRFHFCRVCRYSQTEKWTHCPECNSQDRIYFPSETEMKRGALLLTLESAGTISMLKFQPRYDLVVNGRKICTYVADAQYVKDGAVHYEDSKPKKFIDDLAKLKIALFEAIYGVRVTIPQQNKRGD